MSAIDNYRREVDRRSEVLDALEEWARDFSSLAGPRPGMQKAQITSMPANAQLVLRETLERAPYLLAAIVKAGLDAEVEQARLRAVAESQSFIDLNSAPTKPSKPVSTAVVDDLARLDASIGELEKR